MLMTREMDYLLRILRALHRHGQLSAGAIAAEERIPRSVTVKLLKRLHAAGLVESRRGSGGGYLLKVPCGQLTLYRLFDHLGERPLLNRCQDPDYRCERAPEGNCGICRELDRVQRSLDEALERTPLSEVF